VHLLIPALLFDITRRCNLLEQRLESAAAAAPSVRYQAKLGQDKARLLRAEAEGWLAEASRVFPALDNAEERGGEAYRETLLHFIREYERLSGDIGYYERFLLTPVEHYNPRLTVLCRALLEEVNWPLEGFLVGAYADSEDGSYWTVASLRVIGAPVGEVACLLGLPDLCHELGHHLVHARREALVGRFDERFAAHEQYLRGLLAPRWTEFEPTFRTLVRTWTHRWVEEFVADLVATYIVGPTFGWQHLRLCAGNPRRDVLEPFAELARESHPHDDVRMFAITKALRLMGADAEAEELDRVWEQYARTVGLPARREIERLYPPDVILGLVDSAIEGCGLLALRRFDHADPPPTVGIVALMAAAWQRFRSDPASYTAWERERLGRLAEQLDGMSAEI
jgi:hypothetical protein